MLTEIAVGDAYGAGFEYVDRRVTDERNDLSGYIRHPTHGLEAGHYTDDTQMSIALAEAMLSGERWTPLMLATHFVRAFRRDQRTGYAQSFYHFLTRTPDGETFLANIRPDSDKSGAAMRAGPIGLFPTIGEVIDKCTVQAAITHNTTDGINAACAAALLVHYLAYDIGPRASAGDFIKDHVPGQWAVRWEGKVKAKGWMSVRAAITAVSRNETMSDLLRDCIHFGGDVDTVAAIALAAGSVSGEVEQDLPVCLLQDLEKGEYGRHYLAELDRKLANWSGMPSVARPIAIHLEGDLSAGDM
jgi:ADP-ribosyl-[dinitrogen reductase] hydrolase